MDAPPGTGRPDPGVDLQVKMAVRVTGSGGVVPDHRRLDPFDRDLHLTATRPHPRRRMLGDPTHDLRCSPVLRGIQRGRDLRMQRCRQRPGLRPVHRDLEEPQRIWVVTHPTLPCAGVDVDPGDPLLIRIAGQLTGILDTTRGSGESGGDSGALGEVVVISP